MAKLHFYYSAMNAGKSTTLLQSSYNYQERGMETLLYTPSVDTRYEYGKVFSRIGLEAEAIPFDPQFDLFAHTQKALTASPRIRCVLIDEAQFLSRDQVHQLTEIVDKFNIPVLAYGLRTDYMGELFEGSKYLLAWAEELTEIKTICHCGRKATMNMRINANREAITSGQQIAIGGNESYISTCRKHFKLGDAGGKRVGKQPDIEEFVPQNSAGSNPS